jgi:flagellar FliL protein
MATAPKAVPKAVPAEAAPEAVAPKKSKKPLLLILIILIVLLAGGGGAAWYFMGQQSQGEGDAHKAKAKEPAKPPVFMVIEPFTVNLQPDGAGDQYLQVAFSLQLADEKEVETIKMFMPQVRSRLLLLLSGKKASEISTPEGKKKLAEEIIATVKQPFAPAAPAQHVSNVFFTSFVIQ